MIEVLLLLALAAAALVAGSSRRDEVDPSVVTVTNIFLPGTGLALVGRPSGEVVLAVVLGALQWLSLVWGHFFMGLVLAAVAAAWGVVASGLDVKKLLGLAEPAQGASPLPAPSASPVGATSAPSPPTPSSTEGMEEQGSETHRGFLVRVDCSECGAPLEVPGLHHAASCGFCGQPQLLVGHDEILQLALPVRVDESGLKDVVLDHYRYLEYTRRYQQRAAALQTQATGTTSDGRSFTRPEIVAAMNAVEAQVSREADAYRQRLAQGLEVRPLHAFVAPYWHGTGSLYQADFGREPRTHEKVIRFALATLEASTPAFEGIALPDMGRLSYLGALTPAADLPSEMQAVRQQRGADALEDAFGALDRKQLVREVQTIRLGNAFESETRALVWRPFSVVAVQHPKLAGQLLLDVTGGRVLGPPPALLQEALSDLPAAARDPGARLRCSPMQCPTCGWEFPYEVDAVVHFCVNCHRSFRTRQGDKHEVDYAWTGSLEGPVDLVPFWAFPLHLAAADGQEITDLAHLRDGIDGTLDQLGEGAVPGRDVVLVPAFRIKSEKLAVTAYADLFWDAQQAAGSLRRERLPLDAKPRPWPVSMPQREARRMAPLYLATAFSKRDLARAKVHRVSAWLLDSRQTKEGRLAFVALPRPRTERYRRFVGRAGIQALDEATGRASSA